MTSAIKTNQLNNMSSFSSIGRTVESYNKGSITSGNICSIVTIITIGTLFLAHDLMKHGYSADAKVDVEENRVSASISPAKNRLFSEYRRKYDELDVA